MCVLTCLSVCVCTFIYVYMYFLCPCASLMFSHAIKFQVASTGATRWQTLLLGRKNRGGAKASHIPAVFEREEGSADSPFGMAEGL